MSHDDYVMVTNDAGLYDQAYAFTGTPFSMASGADYRIRWVCKGRR